MKLEFKVPRQNVNDNDVEIVQWFYENGDFVEKNADLLEVEYSKAIVCLQSQHSGYLRKNADVGNIVGVGQVLAWFYSEISELDDENTSESAAKSETPIEVHKEKVSERDCVDDTFSASIDSSKIFSDSQREENIHEPFQSRRLSRAASAYVSEHDIDPKKFTGLISRKALEKKTSVVCRTETNDIGALRHVRCGKAKQMEIDFLTQGQKGNINSSLTVQFNSAPLRQMLAQTFSLDGQPLSVILYELCQALENSPRFTAFYEEGSIYYHDKIHLGLAMDLERSLKVPVIRNANRLLPAELHKAVLNYVKKYMNDKLGPEDLTGSTITVTDLSNENILHFQPLLNRRQSAILGIGGDADIEGHPMTLTMVFDHHVLTGRDVAVFLNLLKKRVMSYRLGKLNGSVRKQAPKEVRCSHCLIDLKGLRERFGEEGFMYTCLDSDGEDFYMCHVCARGY